MYEDLYIMFLNIKFLYIFLSTMRKEGKKT